jgi:hypothetical protein
MATGSRMHPLPLTGPSVRATAAKNFGLTVLTVLAYYSVRNKEEPLLGRLKLYKARVLSFPK